jgi:8-amino-3,8-dideoxy-alpha-D-manno-octulosonate transaminase
LIFFVENREIALRCRNQLVADGLGTKILPEAYTWHFAASWSHMTELVKSHGGDLQNAFPRSTELINRGVSLPITVKMDEGVPGRIRLALEKALVI